MQYIFVERVKFDIYFLNVRNNEKIYLAVFILQYIFVERLKSDIYFLNVRNNKKIYFFFIFCEKKNNSKMNFVKLYMSC